MYPVVENCDGGGEDAFLCNHPVYDLKQESFVPVIIGLNSAEGGMFASRKLNYRFIFDNTPKQPPFEIVRGPYNPLKLFMKYISTYN